MATLRWMLLVAVAAVLPSCGRDRERWLWVTVHNEGTVSADIWSEAEFTYGLGVWSEHAEASAAPSESVQFGFRFESMTHLTVLIHRSSDSMIVFYDSWDWHELDHLHGFVDITVAP